MKVQCDKCGRYFEVEGEWGYCPFCENDNVEVKKNLEDLIDELKNVEVLALDDFGGETLTSYIRDEVIGSILHDRMCNNKLTFIASNLSDTMLQKHLEDTGKEIDVVKAARIYERVRALMNFVELVDTNYRD